MSSVLPQKVLQAFQIQGEAVLLPGGQGTSVKVGDYILKPAEGSEEEIVWTADLMNTIPQNGFRVAKHIKAVDGNYIFDGWTATTYIEGETVKNGRWEDKVAVTRAFHKVLADIPRPDFIAKATHPWAIADKMTFGEITVVCEDRVMSVLQRLRNILQDINLPNQLIHGDMPGNIMFHGALPPAIIDFSFYWRPAEFATAIVIVDSIVWDGASDSLLDQMENNRINNQLLVRAEIRRILEVDQIYKQFGQDGLSQVDAHTHVIELIEERVKNEAKGEI